MEYLPQSPMTSIIIERALSLGDPFLIQKVVAASIPLMVKYIPFFFLIYVNIIILVNCSKKHFWLCTVGRGARSLLSYLEVKKRLLAFIMIFSLSK